MKKFVETLCAIVIFGSVATAAHAQNVEPAVFSGRVTSGGQATQRFLVTLYLGDGSNPEAFKAERKFVASAETDAQGQFVIVAPAQPINGKTVTIRAKGYKIASADAPLFGGQAVVSPSGSRSDIDIVAAVVTDPNFGIRNNKYADMKMFYVTDRKRAGNDFANVEAPGYTPTFGRFVGSAALGPPTRPSGKCAPGSHWKCSGKLTRQDDAYIHDLSVSGTGASSLKPWIAAIRAELPSQRRGRILLYVHGYNNDFDGAAATATRLAFESGPSADAVVLYSWPSRHTFKGYIADLKSADISLANNLLPVLMELAPLNAQADIELIGHSMGTFVLTRALQQLQVAGRPFASLTFFAGDTDVEAFLPALPAITRAVRRITVYSNGSDQALRVSQCLSGDGSLRIGQTPQKFPSSVRWFDATSVAPRGNMGHGYVVESFEVAADFRAALESVSIAQARNDLALMPWLGGVESIFSPDYWTGSIASSAVCGIFAKLP